MTGNPGEPGTRRAPRRSGSTTSGGGSVLPTPHSSSSSTGGFAVPKPVPGPVDQSKQRAAKRYLMDEKQLKTLAANVRLAELYVNGSHLDMLSPSSSGTVYQSEVLEPSMLPGARSGIVLFRITGIMFNKEENSYEKLVSVYSAMNTYGGVVAMILQSDGKSVSLYLGVNTSGGTKYTGSLLAGNLRGQFPGCEVRRLSDIQKDSLLEACGKTSRPSTVVHSLSMIPSRRQNEEEHDKEYSAQGYEKFIDAMKGKTYTLIVLSQRIAPDAMDECLGGLQELYTALSPYMKETASYSENEVDTVTYGISSSINDSVSSSISRSFGTSHTRSINNGRSMNRGRSNTFFGMGFSSGSGTTTGTSEADGTTDSTARSSGHQTSQSSGKTDSTASASGRTGTITMNRENRAVQDLLAKIQANIERINTSQTFGMWNSACYMIAEDPAVANMGTNTLASIFSGDSKSAPRAYYNRWDISCREDRDHVLEYLSILQHPMITLTVASTGASAGKSQTLTPAMMISGREIPTLMGLPRRSVPGIIVQEMADFGRNIPEEWKKHVDRPVPFGEITYMRQTEGTPMILDLDAFSSHTFICGASGSGKSNTTYNLMAELSDRKVPFLVIEPAKGEYKDVFGGMSGINIFTADNSDWRRLKINPFELGAGETLRSHLSELVQVVSACWPLYGAMPGLLRDAFEQVYLNHGWDLDHSERILERGNRFPVFRELIPVLEKIINEGPFSADTKGDYKGALLFRVSSLCNGMEGDIFGRSIGVSDKILFDENTVIDLSSVKSDESRGLIMGILISRLNAYRKMTGPSPHGRLRHVTVLEEAHTILKRCSHEKGQDSGNVQGHAVEALCRSIAELRSTGEGFMIIDQSPTAVDETAIKNTAVKIVMRLPAKNDCEEMGSALSLTDEQSMELSRLGVGDAAVYHAGWTETILGHMGRVWDDRFRLKVKPECNRNTYTRIAGALLQQMYVNIVVSHDVSTLYDDLKDLLNIFCSGSMAIKPLLPESKQLDILDEIRVFQTNNADLIRDGKMKDLEERFFEFVFQFLQLHSLMRILPLENVNGGFMPDSEQLKPKEQRTVLQWANTLVLTLGKFLHMPEKCEPSTAYRWPLDPPKGQYFYRFLEGLIQIYDIRYFSKDFRYFNALVTLRNVGYFRKGSS